MDQTCSHLKISVTNLIFTKISLMQVAEVYLDFNFLSWVIANAWVVLVVNTTFSLITSYIETGGGKKIKGGRWYFTIRFPKFSTFH